MQKELDRQVGVIAGAIYGDIAGKFPETPLMLVPPITFKVRKTLEALTDLKQLNPNQRNELAKDISVAIIPMLFSYELELETINALQPLIEAAALRGIHGASEAP